MNDTVIISKMNEFMFTLSGKMRAWMGKVMPKVRTENWWSELVISNLTYLQREQVNTEHITDLDGLDLAMMLRVIDRSWFVISSTIFINNKDREYVKQMQQIRNDWAHITAKDISKKKVIDDVGVIIELMTTFGATMSETRDMEAFIFDVEDDKQIQKEPEKKPDIMAPKIVDTPTEIVVGSLVTLTSDNSVMGAVIGINGGNYSVLVNGAVQNFFKEQIQLKVAESSNRRLSLNRVRTALTAYQINNPSSSNLYSLNSARIDFVPYQFRPALKMIKSDSPKLLVADDVGVGKTIEAGLILKEMEARSNINSVLIICPRPLVAEKKWVLEMKRFDEDFTQLDGRELAQCISETDRDGEWPDRHKKTIIPYSLFGEDSIMGTQSSSEKKRKGMGLAELDPLPHFDLVIVDEAHNIRNSNTWMYKGVELLTRSADAVVFLTATPLQNSNNDLYTLLNLLRPDVIIDKDTFATMAQPNMYVNELLRIVRKQGDDWQDEGRKAISNILQTEWGRNVIQHNPNFEKVYALLDKTEISQDEKIEAITWIESLHSFNSLINRTRRKDIEDFCIRRTLTLRVPFNGVQRDLYDSLMEFESTALTMLHGSRSVRFMMCTIMRQASSCIYGLAPFMNDIVRKRFAQIQEDGELYEMDFMLNDDDENSLFELADEIAALSDKLPENDPKFEKMYEVICQKAKEDNNRVIIFSSFRHTLSYVRNKLKERGIRVGQVDGAVPDEERFALRQRFLMDRSDDYAIDVLLFSEVGCEGLDYQFCDTMINYDLPWNPMRIEQRIGRIDRRGQKSDTVKIYNMITEDTIDATIYDRCLSKIGIFEASIGDCSEILGDISDQILKIMFDPGLSDNERQIKIEQMADNEVMKVQEMQRLEQDEKALFGFDLTNYTQNKDVQDAENTWISPSSINNMLNLYMDDVLGEGEYLRGKSELKSLRLAGDKRQILLDELKKTKLVNQNNASKLWTAYLKSDKPIITVTFDSTCAKDHREAAFFTQMHPFVIQAAQYESDQFPCEIAVSSADEGLAPGDYEFLIYAWKYVGLKPDIKLVAVSENEIVQNQILSSLQYSSECDMVINSFAKWDSMESLHYAKWQAAKKEYTKFVKDECDYRMDQLGQSVHQREMIFRKQIAQAEDEKIIRMRTAQLEKLQNDYATQERHMKETISKADIHTKLLVKGVVHVG